MPELDFTKVKLRAQSVPRAIAAEGRFHVAPGRPGKGHRDRSDGAASIRFPASGLRQLEKRARAEGITLHAACAQPGRLDEAGSAAR